MVDEIFQSVWIALSYRTVYFSVVHQKNEMLLEFKVLTAIGACPSQSIYDCFSQLEIAISMLFSLQLESSMKAFLSIFAKSFMGGPLCSVL